MNIWNTMRTTTLIILLAMMASPVQAGKGDNNRGGKVDEGPADPVFTVESTDPKIESAILGATEVTSHSMNSQGQVVFYNVLMDMAQFAGSWDIGGACDHDWRDGILVLAPKSKQGPLVAEALFWFNSELESMDGATHLMTLEGVFDEPDNWPPLGSDEETTITFNYWEFKAENKKARRQDCSGESGYPAGPWTFTVTRLPESTP